MVIKRKKENCERREHFREWHFDYNSHCRGNGLDDEGYHCTDFFYVETNLLVTEMIMIFCHKTVLIFMNGSREKFKKQA